MRWFGVLIVVLAGCATQPIYLRNPETGDVVKCGPYNWTNEQRALEREAKCINDFQSQGYMKIESPPEEPTSGYGGY